MTREEAISVIKSECYVFNPLDFDGSTRINTALDMAIKALDQESIKEHREFNDISEVKKIIKEYYNEASYGLFFNRNNVGDKMINIYNKNGIQIDICYNHGYFEIFGLNSLQKTELTKFYENLKNDIRK